MEQETKEKNKQRKQPNLRKVAIWTFVVSITSMLVLYVYSYVFPYPLKPAALEKYFSQYEDFDYATSPYIHILRKGNTVWVDDPYYDYKGKWEIPGKIISINQSDLGDYSAVIIFSKDNKYYARMFDYNIMDSKKEFEIKGQEYISSIESKEGVSFFVIDKKKNTLYEYFTNGKLGRQIQLSKNAKTYKILPNFQLGLLIIEEKELIYIKGDKTIKKPFESFGKSFLLNNPYGYESIDTFIICNGKSFYVFDISQLNLITKLETAKIYSKISDFSLFVNSDEGTYVVFIDNDPNNLSETKIFLKKILQEPIDPSKLATKDELFSNALIFAKSTERRTTLRWIEYCYDGNNTVNWRHQVIENYYQIDGEVEQIFKNYDDYIIKSSSDKFYEVPSAIGFGDKRYALFNTIPYKRLDSNINWFLDRLSMNIYQNIINRNRDMSIENVFRTIIQLI